MLIISWGECICVIIEISLRLFPRKSFLNFSGTSWASYTISGSFIDKYNGETSNKYYQTSIWDWLLRLSLSIQQDYYWIPFVGHIFTHSIIQQQVDSSRFLINAAIIFNTNTCHHRGGGGGGEILENFWQGFNTQKMTAFCFDKIK